MKLPLRLSFLALLVAASAVFQAQSAYAAFGVMSVSGATLLPAPPPPNVLPGSDEVPIGSPLPICDPLLFVEVLGGTVVGTGMHPLGLDVDHNGTNVIASPTISGNVVNPLLVSATIPVGTRFNSYMFHFDPALAPAFALYISTLTFDHPVIGVQLFSAGFDLDKPSGTGYTGTLEQGDFQIGLNGGPAPGYYPGDVNYPPLGLASRGVEEDFFKLAIAGTTVTLVGSASGAEIDQIRIFTAVPEAASVITWAIIFLIGSSIAFVRRQS